MNTIPILPITDQRSVSIDSNAKDATLRAAARDLEASFLSEMLKAAGLDNLASGFGGGVGEDQFASFLREEQAKAMADAGGIGLAESLFNAMREIEYAN